MRDLIDIKWMYAKAALFVAIGILSVILIISEHPSAKLALLLLMAIWSFCRAYYFAFYVVERYIDPKMKFSGLIMFLRYLITAHLPGAK